MKADNPHFNIAVRLLKAETAIREAYNILDEGKLPPLSAAIRVRIAMDEMSHIAYDLTLAQSHHMAWNHNIFCPIRTREKEIHDLIETLTRGCSCEYDIRCSNCQTILDLQAKVTPVGCLR